MKKTTTRRQFVQSSLALGSALAFPAVIPASALGLDGTTAPSNRVTMGVVGCGFGSDHWSRYARVLAVCDVKRERRLERAAFYNREYGAQDCRAYEDYREVLERDDIDCVYIATPDHWHALVAIAAARAGKAIYCQKPLTLTFREGVAVRDAVNRYGVVFQHGTQQRSDPRMVFGCELVLNGRIGQLKNVEIVMPAGAAIDPQPVQPVPDGFNYDMWLGPAPWAPYTHLRTTGDWHSWYFISDYCLGHLSGWGVHHIDSAQQGTGADDSGPVEVDARGEFPTKGLYDAAITWRIRCTFADGVVWNVIDTVTGRDFCRRFNSVDGGVLFEGTEGWVFIWRGVVDAHPKHLLRERIHPDETNLYHSSNHYQNFIDCVRSGARTAAPVEYGHRSTTICVLSDISMRLGRPLRWDAAKEEIVDDPAATRMLSRAYRQPWVL
ncbi:Gfo/Idh/MocA family oxidoreductase [bacterium]|nr:Gfo/Idh/MocA family oxidoreductase [bacterium]